MWIASVVSSLFPFYAYLYKKDKVILFEMQSEFWILDASKFSNVIGIFIYSSYKKTWYFN